MSESRRCLVCGDPLRNSCLAPGRHEVHPRCDTYPKWATAMKARIDEYKNATQPWVDQVAHYRNLAIQLGAKPQDMLNDWDMVLCEHWDSESSESVEATRADISDAWDQVEALERIVRDLGLAMRRVRDEAKADGHTQLSQVVGAIAARELTNPGVARLLLATAEDAP